MMRILSAVLAIVALVFLFASYLPWTSTNGDEKVVQNPAAITLSQKAEQGKALFRNKGCVTCHRHDGVDGSSELGNIGPNLSEYRPNADFIHNWLRDPATIRPETRMPNLNLSEDEISALVTFLSGDHHDACPITKPAGQPFSPPAPHSAESPIEDHFWYGSDELWTLLRSDGEWKELPASERGFGQKVVWWRDGYDWQAEPKPALTVTGRRLDDVAPPLFGFPATNGYHPDFESFMLGGVEIPTTGCWEITGHYADQRLTFVVWVAP